MFTDNGSIYFTFSLYFVAMLFIGLHFYRKTDSLSDYVLGGRSLGPWVGALSACASDMSGWLLMGLPGAVYSKGLGGAFWMALGLALGTWCNWLFVAKKLRRFTESADNSLTISEYLEVRFQDKTKVLRFLSGAFIIIFFIFYTASGFVAGAKLFTTVFDISYFYSLLISVVVIISYTFLGGFLAVSWTDFFQGLLMFFAICFVCIFGFSLIKNNPTLIQSHLPLLSIFDTGKKVGLLTILSSMAWGLGYFGQPHILTRFMGLKSEEAIRPARFIAVSWTVICLFAAILVGLIGYAHTNIAGSPAGFDSEKVFMLLIEVFFHPLIAGIMLAAILAAVMSTADSQLIVVASSFTEDFYKFFIKRKISEKELVYISRITVVGVAILAGYLASDQNSSVLDLVSYAWAGFGAAFGPIILFSLFWKRMTGSAAISGMICGGLTIIVWKNWLHGGIFDIYELLPGFIIASLVIVSVSLLGKLPDEKITAIFDK